MNRFRKISKFALPLLTVVSLASCTKLDESLNSTLTSTEVAATPGSTLGLVNAAYSDLTGLMHSQDQLFSLQENTTDESLVPTRGGDWDDNGVWRVLHSHNWNADHGQILSVFNNLNKLSFDATNVLLFKPTAQQTAEAKFLRAMALYHLLDLYGQYPYRDPGENLLNAPVVKRGAEAIDFIIAELNAALPGLPASPSNLATADAARFLLMRCYLNRGAFLNRVAPTFAAADMQQVITLGNAIINSNKYSFTTNYFDNFSVDNDVKSREAIFTYLNTSGVAANNGGPQARWNMTLHYNSYTPVNPNAGWNGFSTISDFYSSFNTSAAPTAFGPSDTLFDRRLGGRFYTGATNVSGLRPGFLVNQQFNERGEILHDRNWKAGVDPVNTKLLSYTPAISNDMIEKGTNLEVTGIRVAKYVPDYANYGGPAGNDLMIFRYADAYLMVAEALARTGNAAGALTMVNTLRTARGAAPLINMPLANPNNVEDPNTLIAERGRELYWESVRRTDLIRFGLYLKPWQYKPTDAEKNILFPIPNQALAANPNLRQNTGY